MVCLFYSSCFVCWALVELLFCFLLRLFVKLNLLIVLLRFGLYCFCVYSSYSFDSDLFGLVGYCWVSVYVGFDLLY